MLGDCLERDSGGDCRKRGIAAVEGHSHLEENGPWGTGLVFECGRRELVGIKSATMNAQKDRMEIRLQLNLVPDESVLKDVISCRVKPPMPGIIEVTWFFRKDASGSWWPD